jgi:GDP/UDP-N,N'-diacetylbacillosamine 2-epimerase (hydrolysing)
VITGTRAEYGLLRPLMLKIRDDALIELQVIVTGMHLSPEFGLTYKEIESDGFRIDRKVEMLLSSDTGVGVGKSVGVGVFGFVDALVYLEPDLIVVLGDRFEIFSAVTASLFLKFPVLHLHGGEVTEGVLDEPMRHAITKMSHVHCVAAEEYRQRVIQLGEQPSRVHLVGGLGVDAIRQTDFMDRVELETIMNFKFKFKNLIVTFHPETLSDVAAETQMTELLAALEELTDTGLIFTLPNADSGGRRLISMLEAFGAKHSNATIYSSLGHQRYLSCMAHCDGVVGNSSSGLLEAPSLRVGTINLGERQRGRLQAESVINCRAERAEIGMALRKLYSEDFQDSLTSVMNPYGDGGASARVLEIIKSLDFEEILHKSFYDISSVEDRESGLS